MRLFAALVLLSVSLAAGLFFFAKATAISPMAQVVADLGASHFAYPAAFARDEPSALGGVVDRIALVAHFPDFGPAQPATAGGGAAADRLLLTLSPKDETLDPNERPTKLYARFFTADAAQGPSGLIMRRFEEGSPYDLEQLFVGPSDGRGFFARCPIGSEAELCLSMFRSGDIDVDLRFPRRLLTHWEAMLDGARALVRRFERSAGR